MISLLIVLTCGGGTIAAIIGGDEASEGHFPYQASFRRDPSVHMCGGAILSSFWVITAAHCTEFEGGPQAYVAVGSIHRTKGQIYEVQKILVHGKYNFSDSLANDLALLKLQKALEFSATTQAIPLSSAATPPDVAAVVSGWGCTRKKEDDHIGNHDPPEVLQFLETFTISNEDCKKRMSWEVAHLHDTQICTLMGIGEGTCMGDEGDPWWPTDG